ncbi:hypothetical protein [Shewanella halifaxensis]|uniref:hypothetical protein n=1 Tax=Shewanella halifaxensis TaxID=271098 RepID=UPI001F24021A|nr:hypothetical protein [Shewanella halifaxensis]
MEYQMRYTLIAASCLAALYSTSALSTETTQAQPIAQEQTLTPEQLYPPVDAKYDWLQLTSLELLKGEIKNLYDDKLEFESDELDTVFIDWEDVKVLQSSRIVSIGFTDLSTKTGRLFSRKR